jgi:hypothetical protein
MEGINSLLFYSLKFLLMYKNLKEMEEYNETFNFPEDIVRKVEESVDEEQLCNDYAYLID